MTAHEYLASLLAQQSMNKRDVYDQDVEALRELRNQIEQELRDYYGSDPRFYYGGSYGKDTMIRAGYDLDIVMYFPRKDRQSLESIYSGVHYVLANAGYHVQPKTVSLRLQGSGGFHVDVVPGRTRDNDNLYATLYRNDNHSTLKTSLKIHIDLVRESGAREMIKLAKLWRIRWGIPVETFPLEQVVIRAMRGKLGFVNSGKLSRTRKLQGDYSYYFSYLLQYLAKRIRTLKVADPSNRSNIIDIPYDVRAQICETASSNLEASYWEDIIW